MYIFHIINSLYIYSKLTYPAIHRGCKSLFPLKIGDFQGPAEKKNRGYPNKPLSTIIIIITYITIINH